MQRFIKILAYGFVATALTALTVSPADAQRGGGGSRGGSHGGGFKGGNGGSMKQGPTNFKSNNNGGQFKMQGQPKHDMTKHNFPKQGQMGKGFAKGEPNPNAPGGFKQPNTHKGQHGMPFKGNNYKDFCGTPYGSKYPTSCNNWKGCHTNWGFNCGWNKGCYPSYSNYCWPKHCWYPCSYPVTYVYPATYCFTTYTPVYYAQPTCVPAVVQEIAQPVPVEPVVTTTVTKSQQVTQTATTAGAPADLSFLTMSVFNQ